MKIAYQGEPGAFSEAAALQINPDAQMIPCRAFEDVFDCVKGGPAGYGVLPIENSIGGSIHRNFDLLLEHGRPARRVDWMHQRRRHVLMPRDDARILCRRGVVICCCSAAN